MVVGLNPFDSDETVDKRN